MDITVLIPLLNEEESLPELTSWIEKVMIENHFSYEILFIDDGSKDHSWQIIQELKAKNAAVRAVKFRRNYGKSAALNTGFQRANGDVVITMDADLQDNPDEIPGLYHMIVDEGYDLVSGWKKVRYDSKFAKNIPSKFFNWTTRRISGIMLHDFNCGLKAYKNEVVKNIEVYGEMHRYIPVIAKWAGFDNIGEKVVIHQKRKYGTTKFGWNRFINGYLDLLSITFTTRFGKKPMHFFGLWGSVLFLIGGAIALFLIIQKLVLMSNGVVIPRAVTDQPLFYLSILAMILGTQFFMSGFIGDLVYRNSSDRNSYVIEKDDKN